MDRLAGLSLKNRALIALITVFVLVFGVITTFQLKQELIPSISLPTAVVYTTYPGASPQVVEERVTDPVEQAVESVHNLDSTTSTSSTGLSVVTVNMTYGTDMTSAQQDLQAAISRISTSLPDDADWQVMTGSLDDLPVEVLSVTDEQNDPAALAQRVNDVVVPALKKVDGVRGVDVAGAPSQQVAIKLDQDKLEKNGLTASDVSRLLQSSGALVSGGSIDSGDKTLSVTIGKKLSSVKDVRHLRLTVQPTGGAEGQPGGQSGTTLPGQTAGDQAGATGQAGGTAQTPETIPLSDVADVVQEQAPQSSISRTNGEPSLTVSITKTPEGNTVDVSQAVNDQLPDLEAQLGHGASFTTVFDQAPFITQSIHDLLTEGGLGLAMAIVVILIFLLSVRSTLVTAVSIPVSVLIALIGLRASDYTLNMLTLGALTISVGRVVDDAIVVIENIKRHLSYGEAKIVAIRTAVKEVATAITAATVTTVAVFLPLALVGGQVGELFRPFAVTVTLALAGSLLVALTIVPVLAYWFLKTPDKVRDRAEVEAEAREREHRSLLQRGYVPILHWAVGHPVVAVLIAILIFGGTVGGAASGALKTNFLGDTGQNTVTVTEKFTPGLSLHAQTERANKVEKAIRDVDGVDTVQTTIGSAGGEAAFMGFGGSGDSASFSITTDPDGDQTVITDDIRDATDRLNNVGDISVSTGAAYGSTTVDVIITAPDTERLGKADKQVVDAMKDVSGVTDVTSTLAADQPMVQVQVKPKQAAEAGLTDATISQALKGILAPQKVGQIESGDTTQDIVVDMGDAPVGLSELRKTKITTPTGQQVELRDVATVKQTTVPNSIGHNNGQRSVTVSVTPTIDNLQEVNTNVNDALADLDLPDGVSTELGGVSADQSDAFSQLGLALLVAIAIVYVVMVATFKSLLQPLILLVSIPFAATGALLALLLTGTPLGVPSLIGLLMLIGIVVTNAIVLIDLVNHYRAAGDRVDQALTDGARQRLRPILMTALATIFALIPMSLGLTGGGVFISQPLAIVVIGGLVSSTVLTLIVVPVLYHLLESRRERRRLARDEGADAAGPDEAPPGPGDRPGGPEGQAATASAVAGQARRAMATPSRTSSRRPARGTVELPATAVDGLATAAEGLARAFRGMMGSGSNGRDHTVETDLPDDDIMDAEMVEPELEGSASRGNGRSPDDEPWWSDAAGQGDRGRDDGESAPRHAR